MSSKDVDMTRIQNDANRIALIVFQDDERARIALATTLASFAALHYSFGKIAGVHAVRDAYDDMGKILRS